MSKSCSVVVTNCVSRWNHLPTSRDVEAGSSTSSNVPLEGGPSGSTPSNSEST
ncbi:hypothetical protein PAXRUDRAFT_826195 [Paxillus rubicundulus Ve08.2h10]|uniref:Uncharacterized protein n=1 Tax=Paxillus rubicundulus Ve08.2h10 TaxID=930991 RepID=A0A0D0DZS5_9AGAM|nr:hypothetical protein PAXRUDRAFT_826195 [Paxillus rubicundulus Ve08.2h10]